MILKRLICGFKGHDPDPDDDLIAGFTNEPRNWMRRCKRCGRYIMHDGAISGITLTLSEKEARQVAKDLEAEIVAIIGRHKL